MTDQATVRVHNLDMADVASELLGFSLAAWTEDQRAELGEALLREAAKLLLAEDDTRHAR